MQARCGNEGQRNSDQGIGERQEAKNEDRQPAGERRPKRPCADDIPAFRHGSFKIDDAERRGPQHSMKR